uniref:DUF8040 domain-containing protein n=1 Tax=Cucumis sativus TaxID=3659 RepID=A0A0A0LCZ7_CUCSA
MDDVDGEAYFKILKLFHGHDYVIELLNGNDSRCFDCFRRRRVTFVRFCEDLKSKTNLKKASRYLTVQEKVAIFLLIKASRYLTVQEKVAIFLLIKASRYLTVQEKVAIFLLIISHNESNRIVVERFQHSGHTISLAFNRVLRKVCKLGLEIISPPNMPKGGK